MKNIVCIVSSILVLVMCMGLFAGCAAEDEGRQTQPTYDINEYPPYVSEEGYSFQTYPCELTVWVNNPAGVPGDWGDDEVSAWIQETLNLDLDIMYATTGSSEELSAMIIGGQTLPDILVVDPNSAVARQLVEFGYVEALDVLAADYYPQFMELLPYQMDAVYGYNNGHFYNVVPWYSDPIKMQEVRKEFNLTPGCGDQALCLNREYYEQMGSPEIKTPDDLFDYLLACHKKWPDVGIPLIPYTVQWGNTKDTVNFFYRMYGGQDWIYADNNGNIQICLDDPKYKAAVQMLNKMYRNGLITQEALSGDMSVTTSNLRAKNCFAYSGQDWQWFNMLRNGDQLDGPCLPIEIPRVEGVTLKLKDLDMTTVDVGMGVFISTDCVNKQRAIEYFAFRYTKEAQIAERFGMEGSAWERNPNDGMIKWTQEVKDFEAENGWSAGSQKYGYNHSVHGWFIENSVCKIESLESLYPIQKYNNEINGKYTVNERIFDLTKRIDDADLKIKYEDYVKIITEKLFLCMLADSEAEFESAYQELLSASKNANEADLEAYFTNNYKKWQAAKE